MIRMFTTKKAFGLLAVLLALILVLNIVTPALPEAVKEAFSAVTHDYTLKVGDKPAAKASDKKEVAYDNGNILIVRPDEGRIV